MGPVHRHPPRDGRSAPTVTIASKCTPGRGRRGLPLPIYFMVVALSLGGWSICAPPGTAPSGPAHLGPAHPESTPADPALPEGVSPNRVSHSTGATSAPPYLTVERVDGGDVLLRISLSNDPRWVLKWNHSVTGVEVSDYYVYEEGAMLLKASHTPAFDAGLGHIPGRGRLESDGRGGYWIREIDEAVAGNAYRLRVGSPAVDHRVVHGARTHSLSDLAAGEAVIVRVDDR